MINKIKKFRLNYWVICGAIIVAAAGLKIAPYGKLGIIGIISNFRGIVSDRITFSRATVYTVLVMEAVYFLCIMIASAGNRNYRRGEEYGSASWGDITEIREKYSGRGKANKRILSRNISMDVDDKKNRKNLNTIVIGGSGSGKTRSYALPNIISSDFEGSILVLDPKGEIYRSTGSLMRSRGYEVLVLNLQDMKSSNMYNPFAYINNDNDVQKLVTNLFASTDEKDKKGGDPFWDAAAKMLLSALIYYLHYEAPEYEQNFSFVLELLKEGAIENEKSELSVLDRLFMELEEKNPDHIAVKYYNNYRSGASKTLQSIQITLASRLEKFNLSSIKALTAYDELELNRLGERKTVLYAIIPDNDQSFNFLVSILYTQLFQQLFYEADRNPDGRLKLPVHIIMDEFANVSVPVSFEKILSVCRSRNISISIIIQNISQLKAIFDRNWESIIGNCDEFVYLGGNESSTHKFISEMIGKETIDYNTYSKQGSRGTVSTNYQLTARYLLSQDEVRVLDNSKLILFIRGEKPVIDDKYILDDRRFSNEKVMNASDTEEANKGYINIE